MDELNLNEYERVRRQKMEALRAKGIEPLDRLINQPITVLRS